MIYLEGVKWLLLPSSDNRHVYNRANTYIIVTYVRHLMSDEWMPKNGVVSNSPQSIISYQRRLQQVKLDFTILPAVIVNTSRLCRAMY